MICFDIFLTDDYGRIDETAIQIKWHMKNDVAYYNCVTLDIYVN